MKCERCGGLTIDVSFFGGVTATGAWEYDGWKCLNCGYVTDPLILKNRTARSQRMSRRDSIRSAGQRSRTAAQIAA
ncbi:MAG: hypothetical protein GDA67_09025 [Nitrospira sp. CR1.3]|nr:hypothetical protein [Nitrospira sp. CR1.3]